MTRPTKTKQHRRDALREELRSRQYLGRIHKLLESEWITDDVAVHTGKLNGYFKLLNKSLPDCRELPISLKISSDADPAQTAKLVVEAVIAGEITPTEGSSVLDLLTKAAGIVAFAEFEGRLEILEKGRVVGDEFD